MNNYNDPNLTLVWMYSNRSEFDMTLKCKNQKLEFVGQLLWLMESCLEFKLGWRLGTSRESWVDRKLPNPVEKKEFQSTIMDKIVNTINQWHNLFDFRCRCLFDMLNNCLDSKKRLKRNLPKYLKVQNKISILFGSDGRWEWQQWPWQQWSSRWPKNFGMPPEICGCS